MNAASELYRTRAESDYGGEERGHISGGYYRIWLA